MSETKTLFIKHKDSSVLECDVSIPTSPPWKISLSIACDKKKEYESHDLFSALLDLRQELEKSGCKLLCNGGRRNIIISSMSRDMGGGRKAYLVNLGVRPTNNDLVDIFDYAEEQFIYSVREQKKFQKKWFKSLRRPFLHMLR